MVPCPRRPAGQPHLQHKHRHLVRRLHHGRDVHRPPPLPGHNQRGPAAEDLPLDGHTLRALVAWHLAIPRVQEQLSCLRHPGPAPHSAPSRPGRPEPPKYHAPAAARDARFSHGIFTAPLVQRPSSAPAGARPGHGSGSAGADGRLSGTSVLAHETGRPIHPATSTAPSVAESDRRRTPNTSFARASCLDFLSSWVARTFYTAPHGFAARFCSPW